MLSYVQIVATPTADTPGTSLLLHFDTQRYVFGHAAEGTQRAFVQRKVALNRLENVFLSGPINWQVAGGLLGLILTTADVVAMSAMNTDANANARQKKKAAATSLVRFKIHAGKNLSHLLATSRRFIFRKGLPLDPHEVRSDPRPPHGGFPSTDPDWKDENINVWYMPVQSDREESPVTSPRKRSHDEFREQYEGSYEVARSIVGHMFDSDWTPDALVETTLHQAKLPAKLFVRNEKGHLQVYTGPMPGGDEDVPDIPVLVRQPWPGAAIAELPQTEPSKQSMCYIVKGHYRRGRFNPKEAERLGVAKQDYKHLANLKSVKGKDGNIVTPEMVLGETVAGSGFAVVDLPDISYIDALVNRVEWNSPQIMSGINTIFWILGRDVVNDVRLQGFMEKISSVKHIVSSPDTSPNMIALESAAVLAYKLRCVDSDRFPLPAHSNVSSLTGTTSSGSSTYEIGRVGKTIQFAPRHEHQDDKVVPFADIEKLARTSLDQDVLDMADRARKRIGDPDFIAKVEKVEADIPNRDAEIITLGTGSALPSKYRNVSATLVRVPGYGNYLFDAGENTLGQMRRVFGDELPSVLRDLKVIWISHLHADHHLGTASVIKAWHQETMKSDPSAKLAVSSHSHMLHWLREYADVEDFGLNRLVRIPLHKLGSPNNSQFTHPHEFSDAETKQFGVKKIEACWVEHCHGALATAFTFPSGLKVAYSGDCRPSNAFVQIGQGATILIHESTFEDELQGDAIAKKHSTMSEAINIGRRMGARRILLTHFSQRYQKLANIEEELEVQPDVETKDKAKTDVVILVAFDYMKVKLGEFRQAQAFLPAIQKLLEEESGE
ncbi:beta-lactamase-like protein [Xylaria arbuscula]|nr:beta-lactamase-like protein [Xylaria arbuscula]